MHFFKKNYINTHICTRDGTGRDWDDPVRFRVPSRPEEKFCPVLKYLGTGRDGRDGTGREKVEHP